MAVVRRAVTRLRRSYVAFLAQQGVLTGTVAGLGAAIIASLWRDNRLFAAILLYEAGVLSGFVVPPSLLWSIVVGCVVAAPFFGALLLARLQPLPTESPSAVTPG